MDTQRFLDFSSFRVIKTSVLVTVLTFFGQYADAQITDTFVDARDGKTYQTVKIGDQWWMAENLAFTDSEAKKGIPLVTDQNAWVELTTPACSWYGNDEEAYGDYGLLYNWYAVDSGNLCPEGWRIPTDADWKILESFLGMNQAEVDAEGIRGNGIGSKLKDTGNDYWNAPNSDATNESGFTARAEGHKNWQSGTFIDLGVFGTWWSATERDRSNAWRRTLNHKDSKIRRFTSHKRDGFSVRCIKDAEKVQ